MSVQEKITHIKQALKGAFQSEEKLVNASLKAELSEHLSPNIRALRLATTSAEVLLGSGVAVSDVVSMALDITDRYCKRKVQFDISSTTIMASQDRGDTLEPLTLIRHARPQTPNNMVVQSLQELIHEIAAGDLELSEAEDRLEKLLESPWEYPQWLKAVGSAFISAGVGIMFGAKPIIIAIMLLVGVGVTYLLKFFETKNTPTFFAQISSATIITLVAALVTWAGRAEFALFSGVNPTLIVIGGIVMLAAGLAVVGAVQDAIDEYYVTANARLLKVMIMTAGIVTGVIIGLYVAKQLGFAISVNSGQEVLARGGWQYVGAMLISAGYALSMQSGKLAIAASGGMGVFAWLIYQMSYAQLNLTTVVASGMAAMAVGFTATIVARFWRSSSSGLIMAGIVPLVPGLTLYNGLMKVVLGSSYGDLNGGMLTLFNAALIAFAIASGASFGTFIGRPMRRTLLLARNMLPRQKLHK
ncbi:hypothetical protein CSA80_01755 [Candidatus Saccharibacteria bacterium]|nr:MAG: hypothetical protein CSA80_01755 [Candidatus Saccharibacteria bacterium]